MDINVHVYFHHEADEKVLRLLHKIEKDIAIMGNSLQAQLDRQTAAVSKLETGVTAELQQLRDAIANSNLTPAQSAQMEASISKIEAAVAALASDDPPTS